MPREKLSREYLIVKVGTALLTNEDGTLNTEYIDRIAQQIVELRQAGRYEISIVTSGAVAAGVAKTGQPRNEELARDQALASIGQSYLMRAYEAAFKQHGLHVGQVLLEARNFECKKTMKNIRAAIVEIQNLGGIPIVNENDVIATEELRKMSNDPLAARFGNLIKAKKLVILMDQDGIFDKNPDEHDDAVLIENLIAGNYDDISTEGKSENGTGGAGPKLESGKIFHGIVHIASGRVSLSDILEDKVPHTTIVQSHHH